VPGPIEIVRRANQRGGRMLSVLDLVDAGTLSRDQAAWLLEQILAGSGWLVGARPGGAGKSTIMGAFLAMLPATAVVHLAGKGSGWLRARSGECAVAYEIGAGGYEAYVWGEELRAFVSVAERGARIVSNLHADTLAEAREQIVHQNGVPECGFAAFGLFLPIRLVGSGRQSKPVVPAIHRAVDGTWERVESPRPAGADVTAWLDAALALPERTIEEVRASWLGFLEKRDAAG
jgi:hypothetical protein